jgi:CDP-paratose 2-epimerase
MKTAIVTGSAGLIGSQACDFFDRKGYSVIGIDNDMRAYFFGKEASTKKSNDFLLKNLSSYTYHNIDIRNYEKLEEIFQERQKDIEIVIHAAAQPSHDWAAREPITDFSINAAGTMNMLELTRLYCPESTFIFTSTNKVYGDRPNYNYYSNSGKAEEIYKEGQLVIKELDTRFEGISRFDGSPMAIDETMAVDRCKHSVFGASKAAADLMCQEYGRYFGLKTGIFRGGCLTGPNHAVTELHGFLSYLVKCIVHNKPYTIFGYKGKQVRDNMHSLDLINMFWSFHQNPKPGEVYNAGGGRNNSTSILEAIELINRIAGTNWENYTISAENRIGDHIWYISDLSKFKKDYPGWSITISLEETVRQMIEFERNR